MGIIHYSSSKDIEFKKIPEQEPEANLEIMEEIKNYGDNIRIPEESSDILEAIISGPDKGKQYSNDKEKRMLFEKNFKTLKNEEIPKEYVYLFDSLVKLNYQKDNGRKGNASGFLLKIPMPGDWSMMGILTNHHVLEYPYKKPITIFIEKLKLEIKYDLSSYKGIFYTKEEGENSLGMDYTFIEINQLLPNFKSLELTFLEPYLSKGEKSEIIVIQHPANFEASYDEGTFAWLNEGKNTFNIDKINFIHYCNTLKGSSGSPLILKSNHKVIGLHKYGNKEYNGATDIRAIVKDIIKKFQDEFKKLKNDFTFEDIYSKFPNFVHYFIAKKAVEKNRKEKKIERVCPCIIY